MTVQQTINEINRMKDAIARTQSPYLKRDYTKAIKRLEKGLRYDKRAGNQFLKK